MSELEHLIWFIAAAIMTATVLTVGTLGSAGLLPGQRDRDTSRDRAAPAEFLAGTREPDAELPARRHDERAT